MADQSAGTRTKNQKKKHGMNQGANVAAPKQDTPNTPETQNSNSFLATSISKNKFESNNRYFTISVYSLFVIFIGSLIIYAIMNMTDTLKALSDFVSALSPFIVALFLALILDPLMNKLYQFLNRLFFKNRYKGLCKGVAILLTYLLFASLVITALVYVIPEIITSLQDLTNNIPAMYNSCLRFFTDLEKRYPNLDLQIIMDQISALEPKLIEYGTSIMTDAVPFIVNISVSIVKVVINLMLSIVISCYLMTDKQKLKYQLKQVTYAFFSESKSNFLVATSKECCRIFSSFFVGKAIDSLIIGLLCFLVLTILQIPYSLLLSVIVGITNMIPYFGPFIGAVPGILILLLTAPIEAVIFTIAVFVLQQFDGLILGPKILGDSTGLTPLWVIFAITIGGHFLGVAGMFLGVPITAVIAYLLNTAITQRLQKKKMTAL